MGMHKAVFVCVCVCARSRRGSHGFIMGHMRSDRCRDIVGALRIFLTSFC